MLKLQTGLVPFVPISITYTEAAQLLSDFLYTSLFTIQMAAQFMYITKT